MQTVFRVTHTFSCSGGQSPSGTQVQTAAHFHYHDINIVSFDGLTPHLKLSASLPLFQVRFDFHFHLVLLCTSKDIANSFSLIDFLAESAVETRRPASSQSCDKGINWTSY